MKHSLRAAVGLTLLMSGTALAQASHLWVGSRNVDDARIWAGTYTISHTIIEDGEQRALDPQGFARVHRPIIINVRRMKEMRPLPSGDCEIELRSGTVVRLSRSYREAFERRMTGTHEPNC